MTRDEQIARIIERVDRLSREQQEMVLAFVEKLEREQAAEEKSQENNSGK